MRYIFISDVHGNFDKMTVALKSVDFDMAADTLVMLGDPFDRGTQSKEILEYVMKCPNRILIAGNHELRFKQLVLGQDFVNKYDRHNGVEATLTSFCDGLKGSPAALIAAFRSSATFSETRRLFWRYMDELVYGAEWSDLIAVHGWIPFDLQYPDPATNPYTYLWNPTPIFREDWRNADRNDWYDATWANTERMIKLKLFPSKRMIIGHFHVNVLRAASEGTIATYAETENYGTYETEHFIAIDGCVNLPYGKVNAYVYESDEEPKLYF